MGCRLRCVVPRLCCTSTWHFLKLRRLVCVAHETLISSSLFAPDPTLSRSLVSLPLTCVVFVSLGFIPYDRYDRLPPYTIESHASAEASTVWPESSHIRGFSREEPAFTAVATSVPVLKLIVIHLARRKPSYFPIVSVSVLG